MGGLEENLSEDKNSVNNTQTDSSNNLTRYIIYQKLDVKSTKEMECLLGCIDEYLDNSSIALRKSSLGTHMTYFRFYADKNDEPKFSENLFYYFYKQFKTFDSELFFNSIDVMNNFLFFNVSSGEHGDILPIRHRNIVYSLEPFIKTSRNLPALEDQELFKKEQPYILENFRSHVSIGEKKFTNAKTDDNMLVENLNEILKAHKSSYSTELAISRRENNKWVRIGKYF